MGRLFWKFFAFVWLAQLVGIIAVGSLFWLTDPRGTGSRAEHEPGQPPIFAGPPPRPPAPRYWPRNMPPPMAVAATLAASVVTALLLAWYVAKPIRSLREAFEATAAGDLNRRIAAQIGTRDDELADLGRVRVLDEGRGIPPDELPHLFTPFARGVNTVGSDGYGLGLAIARRCVEAHRGTIRADNRPAGGLCVEIVLPWPRNAATNHVERHDTPCRPIEPQRGGGPP